LTKRFEYLADPCVEIIFISIFPTGMSERWDMYLIPPPGELVSGTYTAPGEERGEAHDDPARAYAWPRGQ
jgi:hypothetical protein